MLCLLVLRGRVPLSPSRTATLCVDTANSLIQEAAERVKEAEDEENEESKHTNTSRQGGRRPSREEASSPPPGHASVGAPKNATGRRLVPSDEAAFTPPSHRLADSPPLTPHSAPRLGGERKGSGDLERQTPSPRAGTTGSGLSSPMEPHDGKGRRQRRRGSTGGSSPPPPHQKKKEKQIHQSPSRLPYSTSGTTEASQEEAGRRPQGPGGRRPHTPAEALEEAVQIICARARIGLEMDTLADAEVSLRLAAHAYQLAKDHPLTLFTYASCFYYVGRRSCNLEEQYDCFRQAAEVSKRGLMLLVPFFTATAASAAEAGASSFLLLPSASSSVFGLSTSVRQGGSPKEEGRGGEPARMAAPPPPPPPPPSSDAARAVATHLHATLSSFSFAPTMASDGDTAAAAVPVLDTAGLPLITSFVLRLLWVYCAAGGSVKPIQPLLNVLHDPLQHSFLFLLLLAVMHSADGGDATIRDAAMAQLEQRYSEHFAVLLFSALLHRAHRSPPLPDGRDHSTTLVVAAVAKMESLSNGLFRTMEKSTLTHLLERSLTSPPSPAAPFTDSVGGGGGSPLFFAESASLAVGEETPPLPRRGGEGGPPPRPENVPHTPFSPRSPRENTQKARFTDVSPRSSITGLSGGGRHPSAPRAGTPPAPPLPPLQRKTLPSIGGEVAMEGEDIAAALPHSRSPVRRPPPHSSSPSALSVGSAGTNRLSTASSCITSVTSSEGFCSAVGTPINAAAVQPLKGQGGRVPMAMASSGGGGGGGPTRRIEKEEEEEERENRLPSHSPSPPTHAFPDFPPPFPISQSGSLSGAAVGLGGRQTTPPSHTHGPTPLPQSAPTTSTMGSPRGSPSREASHTPTFLQMALPTVAGEGEQVMETWHRAAAYWALAARVAWHIGAYSIALTTVEAGLTLLAVAPRFYPAVYADLLVTRVEAILCQWATAHGEAMGCGTPSDPTSILQDLIRAPLGRRPQALSLHGEGMEQVGAAQLRLDLGEPGMADDAEIASSHQRVGLFGGSQGTLHEGAGSASTSMDDALKELHPLPQLLMKAIDADPSNAEAYFLLGYLKVVEAQYYDVQRRQRVVLLTAANHFLTLALFRSPCEPKYLYTSGCVHMTMGDPDGALHYFTAAFEATDRATRLPFDSFMFIMQR